MAVLDNVRVALQRPNRLATQFWKSMSALDGLNARGLAVIFGLLRVINFAHGAQYLLGAFVALLLLQYLGIDYWAALVVSPLLVGVFGAVVEHTMLSRLYNLDPPYGLLFTFGLAMTVEGTFRYMYMGEFYASRLGRKFGFEHRN